MKDEVITIHKAANLLRDCKSILIGTGAGMGVDSGLPDFRGSEGFWKVYPPLKKLGLQFEEMANPRWFQKNPALAWGFYGHRFNLYRTTSPHRGYEILIQWIKEQKLDHFIFTSNVDSQFQKAFFKEEKILECHGSLFRFQCNENCGKPSWTPEFKDNINIDESTLLAKEPFPSCPACGRIARPNILMFDDWSWDSRVTTEQNERFNSWLNQKREKLIILEIGAGTTIPRVRDICELVRDRHKATLIRINPRESMAKKNDISIPLGAKQALEKINQILEG